MPTSAARSYWAKGRTREQQDALIDASDVVVGLYKDGARSASRGRSTASAPSFVYLADVYVLDEHRGRGLGVELVREIVENGPFADRRWVLHTRDAHTLYAEARLRPERAADGAQRQPAA